MESQSRKEKEWRARLFRMVSVGVVGELVNRLYDIISTGALIANLAAGILYTFDTVRMSYGGILAGIETITVVFFAVDYVLRLITAPELYPDRGEKRAYLSYMGSIAGVIDLMSFLPYCLPVFFPAGMAAFRMFRVARIFRLFRINAYYDSLNVITEVIYRKRQQLLSSVFIIVTLMLASSLCMYSLEHDAQPEVFRNAFSGIWWSASTLLTVGYGDIYPITPMGKFFGIVITFLGVGVVAIPTGIISAGFVEQYSKLKTMGESAEAERLRVLKVRLSVGDAWAGKTIGELQLPEKMLVAALFRDGRKITPAPGVILKPGDLLVIGAEASLDEPVEALREVHVGEGHSWSGEEIREIGISRNSYVAMVRRGGSLLPPREDLMLKRGDTVYIFDRPGFQRPEKEKNV